MSLVKQFTNSIGNFKSYKALSKIKGSKSFLYIFLIFLISYLVFCVNTTIEVDDFIKITAEHLDENVPYFELSNGSFSFDGEMPYVTESSGSILVIDTNSTASELQEQYDISNGFIITEDEVVTYSLGTQQDIRFSDMPLNIDKSDVINFLPNIKMFTWIFLAIWFVIRFGMKLLGILLLTLIAMLASAIFNQRLKFLNNWNVAIYASTLPMLISFVNSLVGTPLGSLLTPLYWGVAILYIFLGMNQISKQNSAGDPQQIGETQG